MANPQLKNGYTKIANELLEAICRLNISGNEMRILLYIIRRTYGFNRSYAEIPLSDIALAVGMRNEHVSKALKKLSGKRIIELHANKGVKPQTISIMKDYQKWIVENCASLLLPKSATVAKNGNPTIAKNGNPTIAENGNTTIAKNGNPTYKENNKEIIKESFKYNKTAYGRNEKVLLKTKEYDKLINDYGKETVERYIERMDNYLASKSREYKDCYAELLVWLDRDGVKKLDPNIEKYKCVINKF